MIASFELDLVLQSAAQLDTTVPREESSFRQTFSPASRNRHPPLRSWSDGKCVFGFL